MLTLALPVILATAACDSSSPDDGTNASTDGGNAGADAQSDGAEGADSGAALDATTGDAASGDGASGDGASGDGGLSIYDVGTYPIPPPFDPSFLPKDDAGRPILIKGAYERLVLETVDPPAGASIAWGPLNDLAGCQRRLLACVDHAKKGSLDSCMSSAHCIGTDKPSSGPGCCPDSCWDAYSALRKSGVRDVDAAYRIFFRSPRCIAGLDDALGGRK